MEITTEVEVFKSPLETVVIFPFHTPEFEKRYGITLIKYWEDGLGNAMGRMIKLPSGRCFVIKELLDSRISRVFAESDSRNCNSEGLSDLLNEMAIKEEDCVWTLNDHGIYRNLGPDAHLL